MRPIASAALVNGESDVLSGQIARKTLHARRLALNGASYTLAVGVYR